ncbi:uncharacterized protein [Lepeophtheirus salmonis]|uniref:uncharacterized protein n=1 Tax=Lepeophtheirus salmonis TaxID=72036 RepID=UPI001AE4CE03|nr:uncharacterized protein LOC121116602 [Lepeophtheirus salmonis]
MRIWYLLLYFFRPTLSTIECELKTDTTNKFGFSESLLKNLKYDRNNSMENMKNLECFCQQEKNETSELFEDNLINEIQKIEKKWYNAQNLILRDCNYVRLVLGNGRTDFASYLSGGILHFMNIKNLIIEDLNVGVNGKTFLGVIFKNVGFEKSIQKLIFQDFLEVRLNNVSVSKNIRNVEIEMSNKDTSQDIESKLIVENSDFRTGSLTTRDTPFYFTVTNEQAQKVHPLSRFKCDSSKIVFFF